MTFVTSGKDGGTVDLPDDLVESYVALGWTVVGERPPRDKPFSQRNKAELIEFGNSNYSLGLEDSLSKAELVELIETAQSEQK